VATVLAEHFGSIDAMIAASEEQLSEVMEIGPVIAKSVFEFLHGDFGRATIADLKTAGVDMTAPKSLTAAAAKDGPLAGKTLVVTGTLADYSREQIEELITQHGGRATSSVSKSTDYLVAGEKSRQQARQSQKTRRAGVERSGV